MPEWLDPSPWLARVQAATLADVRRVLDADSCDEADMAVLLSPAASGMIEDLAARALGITRRHFGRTVSIYVPLYLSNYCPGGCAYCGFAADRAHRRRRLSPSEIEQELAALKAMGFEDVLVLTGERCPEADFGYLREGVSAAAAKMHEVAVESFAMSQDEYRSLADVGCLGVTIYQETYDVSRYAAFHRWGPKRDYTYRLEAPARALSAGFRMAGIGVLLGLADPVFDALALYRHARQLRREFWRGGVQVSFPRLCHEHGRFVPEHPVSDRMLAQLIFAFRICLPDVPLVLSTRESPAFRDGMAGIGISRMSVASRTTVGGYADGTASTEGQFEVSDDRDVAAFCKALRAKGLEPVFKHGDAVYR
jgi:2-iminoacetate synthase